jgi:hypothetical protein
MPNAFLGNLIRRSQSSSVLFVSASVLALFFLRTAQDLAPGVWSALLYGARF